jgi:beta-lactamase regulating signal transducer with metallopeptidase domain
VILSDALVRVAADATIKATLLLLAAWLIAACLRRSPAAVRHRLWALALGGLIALPVLSSHVPGWGLPVLTSTSDVLEPAIPTSPASSPALTPVQVDGVDRPTAGVASHPTGPSVNPPGRQAVAQSEGSARPATNVIHSKRIAAQHDHARSALWTIGNVLLLVWIGGFVAAVMPMVLGLLANERHRRSGHRVTDRDWDELLGALQRQLGIRRIIELSTSQARAIPQTWGLARPVILLPDNAADWPEPTRRIVLLHELAHIQRFDAAIQVVGRLAAALYWFHPLAWFALHRLRTECEHACDDCVVRTGERPTDYARRLLELANALRHPRFAASVAMARSNTLEQRLRVMFDASRDHGPIDGRTGRWLTAGIAVLAAAIATGHPTTPATAADKPGTAKTPDAGTAPNASKGAGRISGRVVRGAGNERVANADVILLPPPPSGQNVYIGRLPLRHMKADAQGNFSFDGLAPGRYRVWANAGNLTSRKERAHGDVVIVPESGVTKPVDLRVIRAVALRVQVKDQRTGRPIPGATVELGWTDFPEDALAGADGVAVVQPLTPERWYVNAWADGYAKSSRWINLENGSDAEAEYLLGPGGSLEGTVRDASGKPLAGAGLSAFDSTIPEQLEYVQTDAEGRYRLRHLPHGKALDLGVSKDDFEPTTISVRVTQKRQSLDVVLNPRPHGGSVTGIVVDHRAQPVAGASVVNIGNSSSDVRETKTGSDGRFRLDNLFESRTFGKEVLVRAKGAAPRRMKVATGPPEKPAEVTIQLEPGHRIHGRVMDDKKRAIAGVDIYFAGGDNPFDAGGHGQTDAQGRFSFDALPPDAPFSFRKKGFSQLSDQRLPLDTDQEIAVELVPEGALFGKVTDAATGKPVRSFNVRITFSPKRLQGEPSSGLLTSLNRPGSNYQSAEGRFKLGELVAGMPLQVTISADGYERTVAERVVVSRSDEPRWEEYSLQPLDPSSLETYRGRLLDEDGKPVAGAQLRLIAARNRDPNRRWDFPFNWAMIESGQAIDQPKVLRFVEGVTDDQGRFEFLAIPRMAEVELVWWRKGIAPGRADHLEFAREKEAVELTIPASGQLAIRIDRKAFPTAAQLNLSHTSGAFNSIHVDLNSDQTDASIDDLAPGEYQVSLMGPYERVPGQKDAITAPSLASGQIVVAKGETARIQFGAKD